MTLLSGVSSARTVRKMSTIRIDVLQAFLISQIKSDIKSCYSTNFVPAAYGKSRKHPVTATLDVAIAINRITYYYMNEIKQGMISHVQKEHL